MRCAHVVLQEIVKVGEHAGVAGFFRAAWCARCRRVLGAEWLSPAEWVRERTRRRLRADAPAPP